ncbi:MAG: hypothetical protein EKK42_22155 [Pseudonocardiaceae bacterium]|nr:MAG: hypothetical protein EKK42_22155 [Pseudonocardiaceae bacterium]
MQPHRMGSGSYINNMNEYDENRVRAAYGAEKYERVSRIKATYDPGDRLPPQPEHQAGRTGAGLIAGPPTPPGGGRRHRCRVSRVRPTRGTRRRGVRPSCGSAVPAPYVST